MKSRYIFLITLLFFACEGETPGFSDTPEIELIGISPAIVTAQQDSIVFELGYKDGDGDLGTNDDSQRNIFITDQRIDLVHEFRLKRLAPEGSEIAIQGSFKVFLENTLITGTGTEENVSFKIYVVDRAGNQSNELITPEIVVKN